MTLLSLPTLIALAGEATLAEKLYDGVIIAVVGMLVVFVSLTVIGLLIQLMQKLFGTPTATPSTPVVAAAAPASPVTVPPDAEEHMDDELSPVTLAVISAAVFAAVRAPARIKHVKLRPSRANSGWTQQGRSQLMTSHKPRTRRSR